MELPKMREYSRHGEHNMERAMQIKRGKKEEEMIVHAAKVASTEERPKEFENVSNNEGRDEGWSWGREEKGMNVSVWMSLL